MRARRCEGYTMVELMVAVLLSLIVVLGLGRIITSNQRTWEWGRDKVVLQQNVTESLEWMARSVRAARSLRVASAAEFSTRDTTGTVVHNFKRASVSGVFRLLQDGSNLAGRPCAQFTVTPNADTTSLTLKLRLQLSSTDTTGVAAMTRATLRNRTFTF
jgi:Tfp pilus assembly protein PilW